MSANVETLSENVDSMINNRFVKMAALSNPLTATAYVGATAGIEAAKKVSEIANATPVIGTVDINKIEDSLVEKGMIEATKKVSAK